MGLDRNVCDINTDDTDIDEYLNQVLGSQDICLGVGLNYIALVVL